MTAKEIILARCTPVDTVQIGRHTFSRSEASAAIEQAIADLEFEAADLEREHDDLTLLHFQDAADENRLEQIRERVAEIEQQIADLQSHVL